MKIKERCTMQLWGTPSGSSYGIIKLSKLAKPKSVEIRYEGKKVIPEKFNIFGEPILSKEMAMLYKWKEDQIRRNAETKDYILTFDVSYEEREFNIPREEFDTVEGIKKSVVDLRSFNQMLDNRRLWRAHNSDMEYLNQFVIFGKYMLDVFGQVLIIEDYIGETSIPDVCEYSTFNDLVERCTFVNTKYIPEEGDSCTCCGEKFTIDSIKKDPLSLVEGKLAHDNCKKNFYHNWEIDKFTRCLVDLVYKEKPKYDLLPNGYCNQKCCSHIPWFCFHTSDGDIIIGKRKRVISIEWQDNFKEFDMAIFNDEDVTKWSNEYSIYCKIKKGQIPTRGKRGIHAWGEDKAIEYLERVKKSS